jgi:hypothetical protein
VAVTRLTTGSNPPANTNAANIATSFLLPVATLLNAPNRDFSPV